MPNGRSEVRTSARERLVNTAYELFTANGINRVGIDDIIRQSGCAKASLYYNFKSKENLAVAVLEKREEVATRGWLEAEIMKRSDNPTGRLLAIFDVFDAWFRKDGFEGCTFINVLLESKPSTPLHAAAADHLAKVRAIVHGLALETDLKDPIEFADAWHMLMKGSIVSAGEGNRNAARNAKKAAKLILEGWPRR